MRACQQVNAVLASRTHQGCHHLSAVGIISCYHIPPFTPHQSFCVPIFFRLSPGIVKKINKSEMPFAQRENIGSFCEAVKELGVKDINNFTPDDLFEGKSMKQVRMFSLEDIAPRTHGRQGFSHIIF